MILANLSVGDILLLHLNIENIFCYQNMFNMHLKKKWSYLVITPNPLVNGFELFLFIFAEKVMLTWETVL